MTPDNNCKKKRRNSRGVALIMTLLLLSLFTVLTLAMVIATSSDMLIDGYYRNFRGSFYAADSGLNAARQYLENQLSSSVPVGYTPYSGPPIASGTETTILSNLTNASTGFGAYQSTLGSQTSWLEKFEVSAANTTLGTPTCTINYTGTFTTLPTCTSAGVVGTGNNGTVNYYTYMYPYKIMVTGQSRANEQHTIVETGNLIANVVINTSTNQTTSFAAYGTLLDQYAICGSAFVAGTMTGKFFSNGSWNFGDTGIVGSTKYIFTGTVGANSADVGYMYSDGTCDQSNNTSDTHRGTTINPSFQAGLSLNQPKIPLPTNSYSQEAAVLNGQGGCPPAPATCNPPTQAQMAVLTNAAGTSWPATGTQPSSGVYMPYTITTSGHTTTRTLNSNAGGIYVQGNANQITLSAATATIGGTTHSEQIFTIVQGSITTTVTLDLTGGTTRIQDSAGNDTGTMNGLPKDYDYSTPTEAAMVYVNGNISGTSGGGEDGGTTTGLSGPSSGAAIQNGSAVTVTATGTIAITGNITYSTEPVTLNTADTLVPGVTNVLGIFTPTGQIQLQPSTSGKNMEIDASLAMISQGGSGGLIAQWNSINVLSIVGGRIANQALSGASLGSRNIWFDQRFASGNFAPPWFPSTTVTTTGNTTATVTVTPSRVSWEDITAM